MKRISQALLLCSALYPPAAHATPTPHADGPFYRHDLLALHKNLVEIPSLSGTEEDAALFLQEYLGKQNYSIELQPIPAGLNTGSNTRCNVLAWPTAKKPSTADFKLLITSHIDVVPPYIPYKTTPSGPITPDTLISGRGSVDAKASLAAQLIALSTLLSSESISPSDVMLLFVVGEETSGLGMKEFSRRSRSSSKVSLFGSSSDEKQYRFASAIFGEPTENKLACGHKGITNGIVRSRGKAGHSGYPQLGKSANEVLIRSLHTILNTDLGSSERYGNTTVNIGVLEGGVAANVIPKSASARLAVRVASGSQKEGHKDVIAKIEHILKETDGDALSSEWFGGYGPVKCRCEVDGFETMVASYGTDVPNLEGGHTSYLYGPGSILVAHGDDEGLRVRDLEEAVEGYRKLILHVLGEGEEEEEEEEEGDL
ncbi:uncharacterized protein PODANS_5_4450 [Podospora anserina S mat+]|uniref:Podospora anserina S mat+ genomic DNA chromosome 5, supercontig 5 n=1 Tax=Podospora anserina (strain S / ATCC MYA-4624 / DSM 980 / FGSC 10383) TaxID=515849 RepID=B2AML5_PODAN|nr:uncharacterized protein PODANS_5_4450 [Podospora anserina S mat+]CAP65206.1 unnamed protein product [Podospora anserina S mat+]CDP29418.1 Putative protein of unknown function [Podospora anserina S mat+]